jgi:putative NIF3 family GTP cyclohydrolase 1 type 2
LAAYLDELLEARRFADYCPNGLQVEGAEVVRRVVCGVTASLELVRAAAREGAQAILVHHGWFWRGEDPRVRGPRRERLAELLAHDINLYAYHLPLDVHPVLGNNVQLALRMGWPQGDAFGRDGLLRLAELPGPLAADALDNELSLDAPSETPLSGLQISSFQLPELPEVPALASPPEVSTPDVEPAFEPQAQPLPEALVDPWAK